MPKFAKITRTDSGLLMTEVTGKKKPRGRPKGSKNKTAQDTKIEKIIEHGYTYKSASCECIFTTAIKTRIKQYCEHGNPMTITDTADFTR